MEDQAIARDRALDLLAQSRKTLISVAKNHARRICFAKGRVSSTDVLRALRDAGLGHLLDEHDKRWMGCVFRRGEGWERIGWESTGSHRRPVAVWRRASA